MTEPNAYPALLTDPDMRLIYDFELAAAGRGIDVSDSPSVKFIVRSTLITLASDLPGVRVEITSKQELFDAFLDAWTGPRHKPGRLIKAHQRRWKVYDVP